MSNTKTTGRPGPKTMPPSSSQAVIGFGYHPATDNDPVPSTGLKEKRMTFSALRAARDGLMAVALVGVAAASAAIPATARAATPPQQLHQVPGYYRMVLGDFEVTALYDGYVNLDPKILNGASEQDIQSLLARHFISATEGMQTAVNGYLVHTGSKLVLVDTGAGQCFGPTVGGIEGNIRTAGYQPAQIDAVLLTHLHPDHACGLVTPDGQAAFPNAEVWVSQAEADFWLSEERAAKAPKDAQSFFEMAQDSVAPYMAAGKFNTFSAGERLMAGISSVAASGHTPGHSGYLLDAKKQNLLIWGDIVHNYAVQFARPEVSIEFDVDSEQAIATRKKLFAEAAQRKWWVAGAHLPFPGLGHVRADGDGYAWVPIQYSPILKDR